MEPPASAVTVCGSISTVLARQLEGAVQGKEKGGGGWDDEGVAVLF